MLAATIPKTEVIPVLSVVTMTCIGEKTVPAVKSLRALLSPQNREVPARMTVAHCKAGENNGDRNLLTAHSFRLRTAGLGPF